MGREGLSAKVATDGEAILVWQKDVEEDDVWKVTRRKLQCRITAISHKHVETGGGKIVIKETLHIHFIIHDQQFRSHRLQTR